MSNHFFLANEHRLKSNVITWIGLCPWQNTPAYGTDSGSFMVTPGKTKKGWRDRLIHDVLTEPVNSAAFSNTHVVVSSRSNIWVADRETQSEAVDGTMKRIRNWKQFNFGGHNVIALKNQNAFMVSANVEGVVAFQPGETHIGVAYLNLKDRYRPFYKIAHVCAMPDGTDLVVAATRSHGVAAFEFSMKHGGGKTATHFFENTDIVDVCKANLPTMPRAIIALSSCGKMLFLPDVMGDEKPSALIPDADVGEAYDLVILGDRGFVLTDNRLICVPHILTDIASFYAQGSRRSDEFSVVMPDDTSSLVHYGSKGFALVAEKNAVSFNAEDFVRSAMFRRRVIRNGPNQWNAKYVSSIGIKMQVEKDSYQPRDSFGTGSYGMPMERHDEKVPAF